MDRETELGRKTGFFLGMVENIKHNTKKKRGKRGKKGVRARVSHHRVICPGGALNKMVENEDQKIGVDIIRRVLEEPIRQISLNAGKEGSVIVNNILNYNTESNDNIIGYNARTDKYEDMIKAGVIDPTKVARIALENAASISGMLLTTECVLYEVKTEKDDEKESQNNNIY